MKGINVDENGVVEICDEQLLTAVAGGYSFSPKESSFVFDQTLTNAGLQDLLAEAGQSNGSCPSNTGACVDVRCGEVNIGFDQLVLPTGNTGYL